MAARCLEGSLCSHKAEDNDCPSGQSCFPVGFCESDEHNEVDRFEWHCGKNYPDATQCVSACQSTYNWECPIGQTCYPVLSCEPIDESNAGWYCGESSAAASMCFQDISCQTEADEDCPAGQSCFRVSCDQVFEEDEFEWYCGMNYPEAARCLSNCPSGNN